MPVDRDPGDQRDRQSEIGDLAEFGRPALGVVAVAGTDNQADRQWSKDEERQIAELEETPVGTASSRLRRAREEFSAITKRVRAGLMPREGLGS